MSQEGLDGDHANPEEELESFNPLQCHDDTSDRVERVHVTAFLNGCFKLYKLYLLFHE